MAAILDFAKALALSVLTSIANRESIIYSISVPNCVAFEEFSQNIPNSPDYLITNATSRWPVLRFKMRIAVLIYFTLKALKYFI